MKPKLAAVKPRIICPESGEAIPLDEFVGSIVTDHKIQFVRLNGPSGSGKTASLRHLEAVFADDPRIAVCEMPLEELLSSLSHIRLVVHTGQISSSALDSEILQMAPWGEDEWIEYLLSVHPNQCASVIARLRAAKCKLDCGLPSVWRPVLHQMAREEWIVEPRMAVLRHVAQRLKKDSLVADLQLACVKFFCAVQDSNILEFSHYVLQRNGLTQFVDNPCVRMELAAQRIIADLRNGENCPYLQKRLSRPLIAATATRVREDDRAQEGLSEILAGAEDRAHPMAASLLHLAAAGWVPGPVKNLAGAYLNNAAWPDVQLADANLHWSDMREAYLARANLDKAVFIETNLSCARLVRASMRQVMARQAKLSGADLSCVHADRGCFYDIKAHGTIFEDALLRDCTFRHADLTKAVFCGADLSRANLTETKIENADFTGANLAGAILNHLILRHAAFTGASFPEAELQKCDMEYMDFTGGNFAEADLTGALLTGCLLAESDFTNACLINAGLADVNWEGACLRGADLEGASFHMGSSRSGMVFSPYPCEGSKTGFYTDDYESQHFKAPEEIRKANLRGADLRGANIDHVDFYLVDLRDALFDSCHQRQLESTGAILYDRR